MTTISKPTALKRSLPLGREPFWYKDAIIYEVHVRAFLDSNADGIGDFKGLTEKLDYIRDLGVTCIWLLPFYPSPLRDDGYDISDYCSINPIFGTLPDFQKFLEQAHRRGLRVITELVVNHTSDQHPWFQRSRRAPPGGSARAYYVWSDTTETYNEARIIFRDFELSNWTWDPVARAYYWHRFYSHQPDLNYDNPQVHAEIIRALDFWLDMGVDGLRLDAVPYLYERAGTSCENLKETHGFLKKLREHVDSKYQDRMLLAEANQWPEEAVTYFGQGRGDECHMAFHFPLMPRIFMAVRMEDRVPIVDILEQTPAIPETSQWALFLRNHDELTLEMVTDEERDYMYRVYANDARARINLGIRRRLAPLLGNDRRRIELVHLLLFSFPGTPVLYYGDELGMGDNVFLGDRNGVRTPMQWSSDRNAGFSRANPHALYLPIIVDPEYHYEAVNAEAEQRNPNSLFWWIKRALTLRKRHQAFSRGSLQFLQPDNRKILAFIRQFEDEKVLVVANLSRFSQAVQLDLKEFSSSRPVELFGRAHFPLITDQPYPLTLSPHAAFWFLLEPAQPVRREGVPTVEHEISIPAEHWEEVFEEELVGLLEPSLANYLRGRRWFRSKSREIQAVHVSDLVYVPLESEMACILIVTLEFIEGDPEDYLLPVAIARGEQVDALLQQLPHLAIARLRCGSRGEKLLLYDAVADPAFCRELLKAIANRTSFSGKGGELRAVPGPVLQKAGARTLIAELPPSPAKAEQSNTAIIYGERFLLKLFRRLEAGINPDLEIGRFLTERGFPNVPGVAGWLEYQPRAGNEMSLAILSEFLPGVRDAWAYTLDMLSRYFERVHSLPHDTNLNPAAEGSLLELSQTEVPEQVVGLIGTFIELGRLLGQRTAELHLALASEPDQRDFAPEPFTPFYQRGLFQSFRNLTVENLGLLRRQLRKVGEAERGMAEQVIGLEGRILARLRSICELPVRAMRIRCHGDFHLGQVLFTGKDFVIIDFEGEPARPLGERRIKRSPLADVAGMIRSFDYVTHAALFHQIELGTLQERDLPALDPWTAFWYRWVSAVYLRSYLQVVGGTDLLPRDTLALSTLLDIQVLGKAVYEVGYEINNRPAWLKIPLRGILQIMAPHQQKAEASA